MKKIITLMAVALMTASAMTADDNSPVVLDLLNPTFPSAITFTGDNMHTDSTYSENVPYFEFPPFLVSHLMGGTSYGGYYWDGFTVCRSGDNARHADNWLGYQWTVMPAGGLQEDKDGNLSVSPDEPYLLGYYSSWTEKCNQIAFDNAMFYHPLGFYVTNTCYAYYSCAEGASPANAFTKEGDSFNLIVTGINSATQDQYTKTIELAGYHNGAFTALKDWTWVDLSEWGKVDEFVFTMTTTDMGDYGANTPTYFGMTRLTVEEPSPTAIEEVNTTREVAAIEYVDLMGRTSAQPHNGVNIVVTHYTDGTTSTTKVMQ